MADGGPVAPQPPPIIPQAVLHLPTVLLPAPPVQPAVLHAQPVVPPV